MRYNLLTFITHFARFSFLDVLGNWKLSFAQHGMRKDLILPLLILRLNCIEIVELNQWPQQLRCYFVQVFEDIFLLLFHIMFETTIITHISMDMQQPLAISTLLVSPRQFFLFVNSFGIGFLLWTTLGSRFCHYL